MFFPITNGRRLEANQDRKEANAWIRSGVSQPRFFGIEISVLLLSVVMTSGQPKKKKEREMVDRGPTALCIAFVTERMLPLREAPNPIKVGSWLCITRS